MTDISHTHSILKENLEEAGSFNISQCPMAPTSTPRSRLSAGMNFFLIS